VNQSELQSFLFVGLGNPGPHYQMTRHNMGYLVVQEFARRLGWSFKEDRRFSAKVAKGICENKTVHLVLPLTFMNLSGSTVRRYIDYFKIPLHSVVVIIDDVALPFDQLRLRTMGSAGGHKGLKSVEDCLGTSDIKRLRMGIGHPGEKMLVNYVLETFNTDEQQKLPTFIDRGVEILQRVLKENFTNVMTSVNTPQKTIEKKQVAEAERIDLTKPPSIGRGE
jgi:peptidyl-tRNA hydrolase, PTH1 family